MARREAENLRDHLRRLWKLDIADAMRRFLDRRQVRPLFSPPYLPE